MSDKLRAAAEVALDAMNRLHGTVTETDWAIDLTREITSLEDALAEPVVKEFLMPGTHQQLLQVALDALQTGGDRSLEIVAEAERQLRAALAEPQPEPVEPYWADDERAALREKNA